MAFKRSALGIGSFIAFAYCVVGCGTAPPQPVAPAKPPAPPPAVAGCGASAAPCAQGERCLFGTCTVFQGDVSVGRTHVCHVSHRGSVSCWGDNTSKQLGRADVPYRLEPGAVDGLTDMVRIAAGDDYTCALSASGEVFCWGATVAWTDASAGEESRTPNAPVTGVARVPGVSDIVRISAGAKHACAVSAKGQVWCWGDNSDRRAGLPDPDKVYPPTVVGGIDDAIDITAADDHTCAVVRSGKIKCWGANDDGQLGDGTTEEREAPVEVKGIDDASQVSAYVGLSCVAHRSGEVSCWGKSFWGGLGDGESREASAPVKVKDISDAVAVSAGAEYACAALRSGKARCWGPHQLGQLGYGTPDFGFGKHVPVEVKGMQDAARLSAGENTTCAIRAGGETQCWGSNRNGMLGVGSSREIFEPVTVEGLEPATRIVAGDSYTCALGQSGRVWCWGFGSGDMAVSDAQRPRATPPQLVEGLTDVRALVGADRRVCAVRADNQVFCWIGGVLRYVSSDPDQNYEWRPSKAAIPPLTSLSGEESWLWGTDATGKVFTWLLRERRGADFKPVMTTYQRTIVGVRKAASVVASNQYACIVETKGGVQCWKPERENLDQKSKQEGMVRVRPRSVEGVKKAVQVAIDGQRACALLEGGSVACWNGDARADPKAKDKVVVEPLAGVSEAAQLVGPGYERGLGCALLRSGQLTCWGPEGPAAESGFPNLASRGWDADRNWVLRGAGTAVPAGPTPVKNVNDATQVALGEKHVCVLRKAGQVACWGDNGEDAVGALGLPQSAEPLVVRIP